MYTPNRPRRPFFRPYQPPRGFESERPHASTVPSGAGFCSSVAAERHPVAVGLEHRVELVDRPGVVQELRAADLADDRRRVGRLVAVHRVLGRAGRGLEHPRIGLGAGAVSPCRVSSWSVTMRLR